MNFRIENIASKKLVGKRTLMSFSKNKTFDLWRSFMPKRKEIHNNIGADLYSIQIYAPHFFDNFNPNAEFEKWAALRSQILILFQKILNHSVCLVVVMLFFLIKEHQVLLQVHFNTSWEPGYRTPNIHWTIGRISKS